MKLYRQPTTTKTSCEAVSGSLPEVVGIVVGENVQWTS
jgi:hypothetical protein